MKTMKILKVMKDLKYLEKCNHPNWCYLYSEGMRFCYDCGIEEPIESIAPAHQR